MDDAVGNVIQALKDGDLWESTLIIYVKRAPPAAGVRYVIIHYVVKSQIWEGGTRVPHSSLEVQFQRTFVVPNPKLFT